MKHHSITLALHGGAGSVSRRGLGREREAACRAALEAALAAGHAVLAGGGAAVEAVVAAVASLEDSPLFNAGRGAVYTCEGGHELDAAVMDGATLRAGAVVAVSTVKNPVRAALLVMRRSPYVMLCGRGAERFAARHGAQLVDPSYFHTRERYAELERARARGRPLLDHDGGAAAPSTGGEGTACGTVGAVALDAHGDLAAATSTGGMTAKPGGRIGDSPVIGAGTYADNASVAVSTTGTGEAFLRVVAAHDIAALVRYRGYPVDRAAQEVILKRVPAVGGRGGAIVLDRRGKLAMVFNTRGMYRGVIRADGRPETAIFR